MSKNKKRKNKRCIQNKQDPLTVAVKKGNLRLVQSIVDQASFNFSETWLEGYALLCTAIKSRRSLVAQWLLSKNCRVNRIADDDLSDTPLHLAAIYNENDIMDSLLEKDAIINVKNLEGKTPLHISCTNENSTITKLLLRDSTIADIPDFYLTTPLHIAVEKELFEVVEILLSHKVNVNAYTVKADLAGFTPLHIAIIKKNKNIVKILLENGADVGAIVGVSHINDLHEDVIINYVHYDGYSPLHLAAEIRDDNIVKLLVNYGADVNSAIQDSGMTPLHISVQNKDKTNVIFFSEYSADFRAKTKDGKNVLHLAVENDWAKLVEVLLLKGADVNDQTDSGETPLYMAVEMGDEDIVEILLHYNADVNIKNLNDQSPLHIAAEFSSEIVKILLDGGANVDETNNNNETPLSVAIKQKDSKIIRELLRYKPNIYNISNKSAFAFAIGNNNNSYMSILKLMLNYGFEIMANYINETDLLYNCVSHGDIEIVESLLELRVDISSDYKNSKNHLLLHSAVRCQNIKMAELLIKHECNLNAVDDQGQTPVGYAIEHENLNMLDLLLTSGAKIQDTAYPFLTAAKRNNLLLIQILLKFGADVNVTDEFGTTALHFAIWNKHLRIIQFLLNNNACINTTENFSIIANDKESDSYSKELSRRVFTSPLHIAVYKKSKEICVTLLEHYANVNAKDGYGRTPLHIASGSIIRTLITYGADINALDDFKRLPIYYIHNQTCVCSIAFQNQYEVYSECECNLYEDYEINDVISFYIKYIALLISMNKTVHTDNLKIISKSDFSGKLQISCLTEIEKIKREKICDCVSFYEILVKKSNALAAYARNKVMVQAFELSDYKNRFPLYCDMLEEQFDIAKTRQSLLYSAIPMFNKLLDFELPEIVVEHIFDFLHLTDLNNIVMINNHCSDNNTYYTVPMKKFKACK